MCQWVIRRRNEVAHRARTLNCTSNRENPATRIKILLANCLLVLRTHRRNEVAHRAGTRNQTGTCTNPTTRVKKVLAIFLLAQSVSHRLSTGSTQIKIVLDGRMVKNLLSTWRKLRLAALLLVAAKSRGGCGGKDE